MDADRNARKWLAWAGGLVGGAYVAAAVDLGIGLVGDSRAAAIAAVAAAGLGAAVSRSKAGMRMAGAVALLWPVFLWAYPTLIPTFIGGTIAGAGSGVWFGLAVLCATLTIGPCVAAGTAVLSTPIAAAVGAVAYAFFFAGLIGAGPMLLAGGVVVAAIGLMGTEGVGRRAFDISAVTGGIPCLSGLGAGVAWAGFAAGAAGVMPFGFAEAVTSLAAAAAGFAAGRRARGPVFRPVALAAGPVMLAAWGLTLAASAGWFLDANAFVRTPLGVLALRAVPGLLVGAGLGVSAGVTGRRHSSAVGVAAAAGMALGVVVLVPGFGVLATACAGAAAMAIAAAVAVESRAAGRRRVGSRLAWGGCGLAAVAFFAIGSFDESAASRLAFGTGAAVGRANGLSHDLVAAADDGREVAARRTVGGRVSLWRRAGSRFEARRDGIAECFATAEPALAPDAAAEIARVALPFVLHGSPRSALLIGDDVGSGSRAAEAFPILRVDLVDGPTCGGAWSRSVVWGNDAGPAVAESRAWTRPAWAGLSPLPRYDVIVDDPGTPSRVGSAGRFASAWYEEISRGLTDGGLFCQRVRVIDLGPEGVRPIAAAFTAVFENALAVAIGPGEWALLGRNDDVPIRAEGIAETLRKRHVRDVLARCGWDWSVPLNLWAVDGETLAEFAGGAPAGDVFDGRYRHRFVTETLRWGAKGSELIAAIDGGAGRLADSILTAGEERRALERLAEVTGAQRLAVRYPDQPWAYRKELRTLLTDETKSAIAKVAAEVEASVGEERRRRVDYFEALGAANRSPSVPTINAVKASLSPHDPLLTPFGHAEVAGLWRRAGEEFADRELESQIRSAHYAGAGDRSVRDVLRALEIIERRPEIIADPADRFAHVDGLLTLLERRWMARGLKDPSATEVVLADVTDTVAAVESSLARLDEDGAEIGAAGHVEGRRAYFDRQVVAPLRAYRHRLIAKLDDDRPR